MNIMIQKSLDEKFYILIQNLVSDELAKIESISQKNKRLYSNLTFAIYSQTKSEIKYKLDFASLFKIYSPPYTVKIYGPPSNLASWLNSLNEAKLIDTAKQINLTQILLPKIAKIPHIPDPESIPIKMTTENQLTDQVTRLKLG